jgi:serine/threonine protein kinase
MVKEFQFESQTTYTFLEELGRGGMGIVYLAERNSGGVIDYVVLKTLKSLTKEDEDALRQEASLAALLRHENIVKTYGLEAIPLSGLPHTFLKSLGALSYIRDEEEERGGLRRLNFKRMRSGKEGTTLLKSNKDEKNLLLIAMDYIDGTNLRSLHYEHLYQSLLLPVLMSAFIISRIARALAYAHHYLIHRDISPENILLNTQGICKLSDFGIAVASHQQPDYWAGKLSYMAPEQIYDQPIDERIDIFSLGSLAYQLLTGIPLVEMPQDVSFEEQIKAVKQQINDGFVPPAMVRSDIPEELSQIVMKMIQPVPQRRYQRGNEIANDLEKKYLYAKGYGPTNNSLATYLNIFENRFASYNEGQLEQLSFLKNDKGETQIKRTLQLSDYLETGLKLLDKRRNSEVYKRLKATAHLRQVQAMNREERLAYLKVKYLDNVIESFPVTNALTIGLSENMDVCLNDKAIAPHHCTLHRSGQNLVLKAAQRDAQMNINGVAMQERELKDGDKIKIASYFLFFINQKPSEWQPGHRFSLDHDVDMATECLQAKDFLVTFTPQPEAFTRLARLADYMLSTTDLNELKLGIIPTALVESVQLLQGEANNESFQLHVMRRPIYLIFNCVNVSERGYCAFLQTFKKHREHLAQELEQKEKKGLEKESGDVELFNEDHRTGKTGKIPVVTGKDPLADMDIGEDFDPSKLAAELIVHSFDRIELHKEKREVELVVYI